MHARKKFTPLVVSQIQGWVQEGLTPTEIAGRIGCTLGTLRVRCSQLGISLRAVKQTATRSARECLSDDWDSTLAAMRVAALPNPRERLTLLVPRLTLEHVRRHARARDLSDGAFIALLLEKIAEDELYQAVLDDCD